MTRLLEQAVATVSALPDETDDMTKEHNAFLDQAVSGLSQKNRVISVRL